MLMQYKFSWRKLWAFTGPGFLMSIAYLDPGNIESDLKSGSIAEYRLLWLLCLSTCFGLFVQILAARIGTVTGLHLAELCQRKFPVVPRLMLWITSEIAIIGSDMQEVIGTAISIYLLSRGYIPPYVGVLITIADTLTFLFVDKYGLRKLEILFGSLIVTMTLSFGYEFFRVGPEMGSIGLGIVFPWCKDCPPTALRQGIGIIGAIIMPHNLYLHSALVKSRNVDRSKREEVRDANRYVAIESAIALLVSLIINIMVTSVFAHGLYDKTNAQVRAMCPNNTTDFDVHVFDDDPNETVDADIYKAGVYLGCAFGLPALYIWAIGVFAAGQSSTMTGTYAGQFVMEGFLNLTWSKWKRVLLTRSLAIAPTLAVAVTTNSLTDLTGMNDLLNALMSLMLPFALLPLMIFSASGKVMKEFRTSIYSDVVLWFLSFAVIAINLSFVAIFASRNLPNEWWVYFLMTLFMICYISFILYLLGCLLVVLDYNFVLKIPIIGPYMHDDYHLEATTNVSTDPVGTINDISVTTYNSIQH